MSDTKIFLVTAWDYEYHAVLAAFSTKQAAEKYRDEQAENGSEESNSYSVEEYGLDLPRKQLPGSWEAERNHFDESQPEIVVRWRHDELPNQNNTRSVTALTKRGAVKALREMEKNPPASPTESPSLAVETRSE